LDGTMNTHDLSRSYSDTVIPGIATMFSNPSNLFV
jgi:hypothetical protein